MPNIKPVSDLRNYNEVLKDVAVGQPVFLTKDGRGKYAVVDIEEYERNWAILKLMEELAKGEKAGAEHGWMDIDEVDRMFGISHD